MPTIPMSKPPAARARSAVRRLTVLAGLACAGLAFAQELAAPLKTDLSALPPLGAEWRIDNPYRGDARVAAIGRSLFAEACQQCHGVDGDASSSVGTDLRLVDIYCYRRIQDAAIRSACVRDNDDYFKRSVLYGKVRVGVVHMPPWKGVLSQEAVWSLRTFLESRRP